MDVVNLSDKFGRFSDHWSPKVKGRLRIHLRDGDREVGPGEFIIVPRLTEHCQAALTDEVHVVLLDPRTTLNTGNVANERTVAPGTHLGRH